jgi:hypothetical protein
MAKGRAKPLYGAKKYDRAILNCTCEDCDEEFFVSRASTPARRKCAEHFFGTSNSKQKLNKELLDSLRKRGILVK